MPERTTDAVPMDDISAGDHQSAAGNPPCEAAAVKENPSSEPAAGTSSIPTSDSANHAANRPFALRGGPRLWLLVIALIGGCGFFFLQRGGGGGQGGNQGSSQGGGGRHGGGPAMPVPITIATAESGDIGVYVNALGYVTPIYMITLHSRVDGQLMAIHYREGQMVKEGDVLAELDARPFQAALTQAQGQYDRDKALLDEAYIDLNRYKEAFARNAIPKQQLDVQEATVHQDEGTVKLDQGSIDAAQVNLDYCTIKSPITGRVGLRLVDPGNIVHAADANGMLVVTQLQPITVVFSVAEDVLPQIEQQLRLHHHLSVDAYDRAELHKMGSGTVEALDNQIDATTGTVRLRASFPNKDNGLFPNQFVNAKLLVDTEHNVVSVPTAAIQRNGDTAFVYILNPDQTVSIKTVTVGTTDGNVTAVTGVEPGQVVAVDGFDKLGEGVKVSVKQPSGANTTANTGPVPTAGATTGSPGGSPGSGSSPSSSSSPNASGSPNSGSGGKQ
ncbi:MAG TPA: efflux RND transporter periplasmic adaptor subunit [Blastocatellia bacterium]